MIMYNLIIKIGKTNKRIKKFMKIEDPVKALLSMPDEKIMEGVTIILEKDGMRAERPLPSFKARMAFKNKLNAFHLIKQMHWILKPIKK